jgi:hypothetical protein
MSSTLRPVREIEQKLDLKPKPPPLPTSQARVEPSRRITESGAVDERRVACCGR